MTQTEAILSQLPGDPLTALHQADQRWQALRQGRRPVLTVVETASERLDTVDWDVLICGGTLGILLGAALALAGWRVALVEQGKLQGRQQEWNISRRELQVFLELGLLTAAQLNQAIATEYNPARVGFLGGPDIWVRDVLNIGIDPVYLLEQLKQTFLANGGQLFEQTAFQRAIVHPNGVTVDTDKQSFSTRLLLDAMGHFSPIVQQSRQGATPDAVCLVVGTCATGYPANETGDLIYAFTPIQNQCQYFWEAFPARDGRTTYLFTYLDAHPDRLSLEQLFADYFRLLPTYQQVELDQLQFKRALFGFFPCYRQSPLKPTWDRILAVGDSSASQSPLSFGGFGAMVRHLHRLTAGIQEALQTEALERRSLALLQPYQPNLSVTWLFQKAMSVGMDQKLPPNQVNDLLTAVFQDMQTLGDPVLRPFLQDVVQFTALFQTLTRTSVVHPGLVLKILPQVGVSTLLEWMVHYANLAGYTLLHRIGQGLSPRLTQADSKQQYRLRRWLDAWCYGSGGDY